MAQNIVPFCHLTMWPVISFQNRDLSFSSQAVICHRFQEIGSFDILIPTPEWSEKNLVQENIMSWDEEFFFHLKPSSEGTNQMWESACV